MVTKIKREILHSPKISIVVLTKNRRELLTKCLNSLFIQSYTDFEIVIVDDHSTDDTSVMVRDMLKEYPSLKLTKSDSRGIANARNCGVRISRGEIIAFTDDDCEAHPDWLMNGLNTLQNENVDFVRGAVYFPDGNLFAELNNDSLEFPTCNIFYKKTVIEGAGMFDERFTHGGEDLDLAFTALKKGYKSAICPEAIAYHPFHTKGGHLYTLQRFWKVERHRNENSVLLFKKHKDYRTKLFWGVFISKTHIIPVVFMLSILASIINCFTYHSEVAYLILLFLFLISYIPIRVAPDKLVHKYPVRILLFPYFIFFDILEIYNVLKGVVRYKYFIL